MAQRNWESIKGFDFKEILFEQYNGIAKITINRPRYRNAFTPRTTFEMSQAFAYCREAQDICVVILTGAGDKAFCSGGDMHVKGRGGYVGEDGVPRLNVLDVQNKFVLCLSLLLPWLTVMPLGAVMCSMWCVT